MELYSAVSLCISQLVLQCQTIAEELLCKIVQCYAKITTQHEFKHLIMHYGKENNYVCLIIEHTH